ncbi:LADA_0B00496g1_1 [Lachancea dasiensis]|uniref:Mediator of RNA polymerase II transcription subunit 16 n=1 Tax=Lachancea dasiensis TaxID=1072105 RepID=A0A1G4IRF7_9SACH|nr:LADA_0B00496g1_1 [Lachancea dasiensis]
MSIPEIVNNDLVSWSKSGLIGYVDTESTDANLCITLLETVNGTNWRLRPSKRYAIHPHIAESGSAGSSSSLSNGNIGSGTSKTFNNISSIYWNNSAGNNGELLAICDEAGNLSVVAAGQTAAGAGTLDNLAVLFQDNGYKIHNQLAPLLPVNDGSKISRKLSKKETHTAIIKFMWLGSSSPSFSLLNARRDMSKSIIKSQVQQFKPLGIFYPTSVKSACLGLRRGGQLDFWYQFSNSKDYKKISLQLNNTQEHRTKQFDWIQTAQFAHTDEDQALIVGAYSKISKKVSFFKLSVNWNITTQNITADPELRLEQILEISPKDMTTKGEVLELQSFEMLSAFERSPDVEVVLCYDVIGMSRSILKRYRIIKSAPSLELCSILGSPNLNSQSLPLCEYVFTEVDTLRMDANVYSLELHGHETTILTRLTNGHTKIYDRRTWKVENSLAIENSSEILTSPFCTGVVFPKTLPSSALRWSCVSPSLGGILSKVRNKENIRFDPIEAPIKELAEADVPIALAFAYAFVCSNHLQTSSEDLTIAIKTHLLKISEISEARSEKFLKILISAIYQLFGVTPEASKELKDKLVMSRSIQRAMLLQTELSCSFTNNNIYNMARTALSLRNILFAFNGVSRNIQVLIHHSATMNFQQPNGKLFQFAFSKQDLIYSLIPCAKWFVRLLTFLTQQMIVLVNSPNDKENTLVLGICSSKITRQLLLSILTEIKKVIHLVTKFPETSFPILNESSIYLRKVLGDSPVNFEKFETFLADVNNKFSSLGESPSLGNNAKDSYLMLEGDVSPEVSQLKEFLLSYSNTAVLSHIKPADVYFSDTRGLRIFSSDIFPESLCKLLQPLKNGLVLGPDVLSEDTTSLSLCVIESDDISKEPIISGKHKLKRCCRCGAVTRAGYPVTKDSTIVPTSVTTKRWTSLYLKICFCSGLLYEFDP